MGVYATYNLSFELRVPVRTWVDMVASGDVRDSQPIVIEYGINGSSPSDRIADSGRMSWTLDNSESNSAATLGYFSPLISGLRVNGYGFGVRTRFILSCNGTEAEKFQGWLTDITPSAGVNGERVAPCVAMDWMDHAAELDLPDLAVQINKRGDEVVQSILDALPAGDQPLITDLDTSPDVLAISLDGGASGERPKLREILYRLCMSEAAYCYVKGDGTFRYENRHHRSASPTTLLTLTDADMASLAVSGSLDDIFSVIQIFVRPTEIDAAATTVLFALQTTSTLVKAGETIDTIFGPYRSADNQSLIGGTDTVDPAATTDYLMNSAQDGSGTNLTSSFTVTASRTGLGVRFTITNGGSTDGYVTKLQVRGKGIYRFDAVVEVEASSVYRSRPLKLDMPYQNNVNIAGDWATYLSNVLNDPIARVRSVTFCANRSQTLMDAAILREPGDTIALSEVVTGIDGDFAINRVRLECYQGGIVWCTWGLEPSDPQRYWLWGIDGSSNWGTSTVYGW